MYVYGKRKKKTFDKKQKPSFVAVVYYTSVFFFRPSSVVFTRFKQRYRYTRPEALTKSEIIQLKTRRVFREERLLRCHV